MPRGHLLIICSFSCNYVSTFSNSNPHLFEGGDRYIFYRVFLLAAEVIHHDLLRIDHTFFIAHYEYVYAITQPGHTYG